MVLDAVSNFVRGTADAAVGTDDTTVSVADASIFPDPATDGEFNVVIWDADNFPRPDQDGDVEILRVTERDTTDDELTVTRGQEMTSAAAHPEGSAIHLSPTAKMFSDIESTFGDFWDAGAQELTADVNNTNTTTEALEAEQTIINNSVDATGLSLSSDPDNPTTVVEHEDSGNFTQNRVISKDVQGDNSAVGLIKMPARPGCLIIVTGRIIGSSTQFTDYITTASVTVRTVQFFEERSTPGARSYSNTGDRLDIAIDDTGETYKTMAMVIGAAPEAN